MPRRRRGGSGVAPAAERARRTACRREVPGALQDHRAAPRAPGAARAMAIAVLVAPAGPPPTMTMSWSNGMGAGQATSPAARQATQARVRAPRHSKIGGGASGNRSARAALSQRTGARLLAGRSGADRGAGPSSCTRAPRFPRGDVSTHGVFHAIDRSQVPRAPRAPGRSRGRRRDRGGADRLFVHQHIVARRADRRKPGQRRLGRHAAHAPRRPDAQRRSLDGDGPRRLLERRAERVSERRREPVDQLPRRGHPGGQRLQHRADQHHERRQGDLLGLRDVQRRRADHDERLGRPPVRTCAGCTTARSISVNGTTYDCATWNSATASPSETTVGNSGHWSPPPRAARTPPPSRTRGPRRAARSTPPRPRPRRTSPCAHRRPGHAHAVGRRRAGPRGGGLQPVTRDDDPPGDVRRPPRPGGAARDRDEDQAHRRHLRREHLVRSLLRHLPERAEQHRRAELRRRPEHRRATRTASRRRSTRRTPSRPSPASICSTTTRTSTRPTARAPPTRSASRRSRPRRTIRATTTTPSRRRATTG